jgi:phosphatidylserine/phosphatidylglycerophosphate/cardiolipin synthase-like enzyme
VNPPSRSPIRPWAGRAAVVVLASLVACAAWTAAASDDVSSPPPGPFPPRTVLFTHPGQAAGSHVAKLEELLDRAAPGSQVRIAIYQLDLPGVAAACGRARQRGVDVRVITTPYSPSTNRRLRRVLEEPGGEPRVFVFPGGFGTRNHNKFAVFSRLEPGAGEVRDVVFVSSGNFTRASLRKHQNTLVLVDPALAAAYRRYWEELRAAGTREGGPDFYAAAAESSLGDAKVEFFPRREGDPVVEILDRIAPGEAGSPARVRVAMARWTTDRMRIAERLCRLREQGVEASVVTRDAGLLPHWLRRNSVDRAVVQRLRRCGVEVMTLPTSRVNLHSKYFLVEAPVAEGGETSWRRLVFTGSPNFTGEALRSNDEALLEIEDPKVYERYLGNFEELASIARSLR